MNSANNRTGSGAGHASGGIEPFRIEIPQADLDDLHDRLARTRWTNELAARGARGRGPDGSCPAGLGVRRPARLRQEPGRVLADRLRLAGLGSEAELLPAVHHHHRRSEHPLPAREIARARRHAADPHPRLAQHGRWSTSASSVRSPTRAPTAGTRPTRSTWSSRPFRGSASPGRPPRRAGTRSAPRRRGPS